METLQDRISQAERRVIQLRQNSAITIPEYDLQATGSGGTGPGWYDSLGPDTSGFGDVGFFLAAFNSSVVTWSFDYSMATDGSIQWYLNNSLVGSYVGSPGTVEVPFIGNPAQGSPPFGDTRVDWVLSDYHVGSIRSATDIFDSPGVVTSGDSSWSHFASTWPPLSYTDSQLWDNPDISRGALTDPTWVGFKFSPISGTDMEVAMNDPANSGILGPFTSAAFSSGTLVPPRLALMVPAIYL